MANHLATTTSSKSSPPMPAHPRMVAAIARMTNSLDPDGGHRFAIPEAAAPTDEQRAFMANRVSEITQSLTRAETSALVAELTTLLRVMKLKNGDEGEMSGMLRVYIADLEDLPLWAICEACKAFRRAQVGEGVFAPTPGELRKYAQGLTTAWIEERAKLQRILDARVLPRLTESGEKRHAEVLAHVRETVAILTRAAERERMPQGQQERPRVSTVEEAQGWLERHDPSTPLPKLSDAARKAAGMKPRDDLDE
jgi:hypothetical protein